MSDTQEVNNEAKALVSSESKPTEASSPSKDKSKPKAKASVSSESKAEDVIVPTKSKVEDVIVPAKSKPKAKAKPKAQSNAPKSEHIYIITSPEMRVAGKHKLGYHSGSRDKLISRYVTALTEVEVVLFIDGTLEEEQKIHDQLSAYRINNVRGNASEWYDLPIRTLIQKAIEVLVSSSSVKPVTVETNDPVEPVKYVGPSKFLDACKDGRWDLVQEWLNSREYKQDKHRKSKINRKTDAALIPWNEAHRWLECLQLVCAKGNVEVLELLIKYCEGRWVERGEWLTQEDALVRGHEAATNAKNVALLAYLNKNWVFGNVGNVGNVGNAANESQPEPKTPKLSNPEPRPPKAEKIAPIPAVTTLDVIFIPEPLKVETPINSLDKLVESLKRGEFDRVIPNVCHAILRDDPETRMMISTLVTPTELISVVLYAAARNWNQVVSKTLKYGLTAAQCARVATSLGDLKALECLVMNFGVAWMSYTREAVLYYVNSRDNKVFDEFVARGVTNWEGALVAAAEFGVHELIPRFLPSCKPEKKQIALQRAILNDRVGAVRALLNYVYVGGAEVQIAKSQEMVEVLKETMANRARSEQLDAFSAARYT